MTLLAYGEHGALYSGALRTNQVSLNPTGTPGFGWGRVDIRAWVHLGQYASWPALWLVSPDCNIHSGVCTWPPEIDVLEDFGSDPQFWAHYFSCNQGDVGCGKDRTVVGAPYDATDHWHTFSVVREPAGSFGGSSEASVCVWLDGQPLYVDTMFGVAQLCVFENYPLFDENWNLLGFLHVLDSTTDPPSVPLMQIVMDLAIGGNAVGEYADPKTYGLHWMAIDSVTVLQPPPCGEGCTDDSPDGYSGYVCHCP